MQFDLLSVDIDSYDLWVWRALLGAGYRPRVVMTEFNRNFRLGCYFTFPDPTGAVLHSWYPARDRLFGASLSALELLARQHGYVFVYATTEGINAFFVRGDLLPGTALADAPITQICKGLPGCKEPSTLHRASTLDRADLYVDYLTWSHTYEGATMAAAPGLAHLPKLRRRECFKLIVGSKDAARIDTSRYDVGNPNGTISYERVQ